MGIWNLYFIIKIFLYLVDRIDFHVWQNLLFALCLIYPLKTRWARVTRGIIALPIAFALLYYDTRFPPFSRLVAETGNMQTFTLDYAQELLTRFVDPRLVLGCFILLVAYLLAKRKLRLSTLVILTICPFIPLNAWYHDTLAGLAQGQTVVGGKVAAGQVASTGIAPPGADLSGTPSDKDLDTALAAFYAKEAGKRVTFSPPPASAAPFDIIIIQVCSMSWDDLKFSSQDQNPLFNRFDVIFKNFNSAASYSGPAAIRLLRSTCGQTAHKPLYSAAPPQCYLYEQLAEVGFEKQWVMNHNGQFGNMIHDISDNGGLTAKLQDTPYGTPYLIAFDGSPIKNDYSVLSGWYKQRQQSASARVALFYNTTSLHDGNRYVGTSASAASQTGKTYPQRVKTLLDDVNHFLTDLDASGRKAVVVVVAEHGADARGDRMQIPFMRENPSPTITTVPLGIRLIGFDKHAATGPLLVTTPTSYTGLTHLLSHWLADSPFSKDAPALASYLTDIPGTEHVSENEGIVVVQYGSKYYIRYNQSGWAPYVSE